MNHEHRILLVDDDLADRLLARQTIRQAAKALSLTVSLREACSGPEALELVASFSPTLLLIDLRMPKMDGFALIRRLRALPEAATASVVVLSTSAAPVDRIEARRLGCNGYLVKPLLADDLAAHLHHPVPPEPATLDDETFQYRALLQELSDVAVLVFDADLRYVLADGAALSRHGWSRESLVGRTFAEVFPPAAAARLRPIYEAALAGHRSTYAYTDEAGNRYEVLTRPVAVADGPSWGMLMIREVTALHRAQDELKTLQASYAQLQAALDEASQEVTQWARFGSHEIAAILRQITAADRLDGAERDAFSVSVRGAAAQARDRLEQMLTFHAAGEPLMEWQAVDVPAVFADIRADHAERIAAAEAAVGCDPLPALSFDRASLRQILTSLLDNALSRAQPGQAMRIQLSGQAVPGGVELSIVDSGPRLGPAERVQLFQPSWQLGGGLGLELASCRRLLDAVGGWIRAVDTHAGLTVSLFVPHPPTEA